MSAKRLVPHLVAAFSLTIFAASGASITWTNLNGGNWGATTNWSPNIVPRSIDTVQITAAGTYTVTIDTAVTIISLTLGNASGTQTLTNNSQTITLGNNSQVVANGVLSLGGGTLTGGSLTLQGTFNWAGATVVSPVTVTASGVLNFGGGGGIIQGPLTNSGTINWSGTSSYLYLYNNHAAYTGVIFNQSTGLFNLQNDLTFNCGCYGFEVFNNAGTVRKLAGPGVTTFGVAFTNTGTIDAQSGTIRFNGGGNVGGTYNTASGAFIEFYNGNFTETGTPSVTGLGTTRLYGANVTLNDRITKFILAAGNVILSPTFEGGGTIQSLQLDGATLLGTNVVTGTLGVNGGTLGTASPLTVAPGGVLDFNGAAVNLYSPLTNSGTINWSGGGLTVYDNTSTYTGIIYNQPAGLFNIQNDQTLSAAGYGFENFRNLVTVRKSAGVGVSYFSLAFTNSGTVDAQTGTIRFNGGGNLGGVYNTASGAFIECYSGNFIHNAAVSVTGSGVFRLNGATVTFNDRIPGFLLLSGNVALTSTFETNGTIQNLQLDGAFLTGTNTVTGTLGINGGGLGSASALTVATNGVLNFNGAAVNLYSPLTNFGTINWSGPSTITVYNDNNATYNSTIYNQPSGLFNLQNDQSFGAAGYGFENFRNAGIVRKIAGVSLSTFSIAFTNSGTVDAQTGTIRFYNGGNLGGTNNTASGTFIQYDSGNFIQTAPATVTGSGVCRLNGATAILNDRISNFMLTSGNVALTPTFETNGTIQSLQLDGAFLLGTNTVTGTLGMNGGGLGSASALTVAPTGVLNFNGAAVNLYSPLTNSGTINWTGSGTITVYNNNNSTYNCVVYNQPSGLFNIQCDQNLSAAGYGFESFINSGALRKSAGVGTTAINVPFSQTGTLDVQSGILRFSGSYSQTGGTMNFGITSLAFYGQIAFNANAPFTGNLSVNLNSGYTPSPGDAFNLVSYTTHSNTFTSLSLPASADWLATYGNTLFTLSVLSVNAGAGNVTLTPISSRIIDAGTTLLVTNTATDSIPTNQITFSLTTAPGGATIGSSSGILQWRAPIASAGTIVPFTVKATDNGIPPASDSKSFNVTVNPIAPVTLNVISYVSNHFTLRINGFVGPDYTLQASTNLVNWAVLSSSTPLSMPVTNVDNNAVGSTNHFYRVLLGP